MNMRAESLPQYNPPGYEILGMLERTNFSDIYHARQLSTEREVALKVIRADQRNDEGFIRYFKNEIRLHGHLEHPFIVPVYDYVADGETLFLVTRLLTGGKLDTRLATAQHPTLAETRTIFRQIGDALEYVHQNNVIHRDVKPTNIVFDKNANAYLQNFAIATALGDHLEAEGQVIGTVKYIAPETIEGRAPSRAIDIYGLAVTAYELLTKQVPFDGKSFNQILRAHLESEPKRPSDLEPALNRQIDAVLLKALAKKPEDRYSTAAEFVEALDSALASIVGAKHIFISYAKKDCHDLARRLLQELNELPQTTAWMDEALEAGEDWALQIQDEIDRADLVVVLLSPDVNRPKTVNQDHSFVLKEIHYAQSNHKPIIPVMMKSTKVPLQLSGMQLIDFTQDWWDQGVEKLIKSIRMPTG